MSVIFLIIEIYLCYCFGAVLVCCNGYLTYKKIYKELPNMTFYRYGDHIYSYKFDFNEKAGYFVWFLKTNDFRLSKNIFLSNRFYTYFDPYSLYWLYKYRKWLQNNIDIDNLENW